MQQLHSNVKHIIIMTLAACIAIYNSLDFLNAARTPLFSIALKSCLMMGALYMVTWLIASGLNYFKWLRGGMVVSDIHFLFHNLPELMIEPLLLLASACLSELILWLLTRLYGLYPKDEPDSFTNYYFSMLTFCTLFLVGAQIMQMLLQPPMQ